MHGRTVALFLEVRLPPRGPPVVSGSEGKRDD